MARRSPPGTAREKPARSPRIRSIEGLPLGEALYRSLLSQIGTGELAPGSRVREVDIAERFGVSRTPVREALKKLQAEGLVSDSGGWGLTVVKPSLNEVVDGYLLREVLEGLAARLAAERALDEELLIIEQTFDRLEKAHKEGAVEDAVRLSIAFDEALIEAGHNAQLKRAIDAARAAQGVLRRMNLRDEQRLRKSVEERREIAQAVTARDPLRAEQAVKDHLRNAREHRIGHTIGAR